MDGEGCRWYNATQHKRNIVRGFSEGVSDIKHMVRSEWPRQSNRRGAIAHEGSDGIGTLMRKCAICSTDVDY